MTDRKETLVLEPSTNTHKMEASSVQARHLDEMGGMYLKVQGSGIVTHGEHGVIVTERPFVVKAIQQEMNPVLRKMQNNAD